MNDQHKNKIRGRCLSIGFQLARGPLAIFPSFEEDSWNWLEADLRIVLFKPKTAEIESIHVFTDDTMNRETNFLEPVIRNCVWNRGNDIYNPNLWPDAKIQLGNINDKKIISSSIHDFHKSIPTLKFEPLFLAQKREVAEVDIDYTLPKFEVFLRNGVQSITFESGCINNDSFSIKVLEIFKILKNELVPFDLKGWSEKYQHDLKAENSNGTWLWNYIS